MQRWKCISAGDGSWEFVKGVIYSTNERGDLIDLSGTPRLKPERYNGISMSVIPKFKKHVEMLENK